MRFVFQLDCCFCGRFWSVFLPTCHTRLGFLQSDFFSLMVFASKYRSLFSAMSLVWLDSTFCVDFFRTYQIYNAGNALYSLKTWLFNLWQHQSYGDKNIFKCHSQFSSLLPFTSTSKGTITLPLTLLLCWDTWKKVARRKVKRWRVFNDFSETKQFKQWRQI